MKHLLPVFVLVSLGCSGILDLQAEAQRDVTLIRIGQEAQNIEIYILKNGKAPASWADVGAGGPPQDGWDHDLQYISPGPDGRPFDIISFGSDGAEGGDGFAADLRASEQL